MTAWQWSVIMVLVRYVLRELGNDWIDEITEEETSLLFEALDRKE